MNNRLRDIPRAALRFLLEIIDDLGTVCLGAAAILLVRVFPASVCQQCQEIDLRMLTASGFFMILGLVLRYVHKARSGQEPE